MPDKREKNPRGLAKVKLGGKDYVLRLTVGAAMDIEEHFDCSLDEIENKLQKVHMKDLCALVQILTRGGGDEITDEELRDVDLADIEPAIMSAFSAVSDEDGASQSGKKKPGGKKAQRQRRGGGGRK